MLRSFRLSGESYSISYLQTAQLWLLAKANLPPLTLSRGRKICLNSSLDAATDSSKLLSTEPFHRQDLYCPSVSPYRCLQTLRRKVRTQNANYCTGSGRQADGSLFAPLLPALSSIPVQISW